MLEGDEAQDRPGEARLGLARPARVSAGRSLTRAAGSPSKPGGGQFLGRGEPVQDGRVADLRVDEEARETRAKADPSILIPGHTDGKGTDEDDMDLSQHRAEAVPTTG